MYNKILSIILIILVILIVVAGGYSAYTYYKKYSINTDQEAGIEEFDEIISMKEDNSNKENEPNEELIPENTNQTPAQNNYNANQWATTPYSYKGYPVDGKLEIPAINIKYLILKESSSAKAIEISIVKVYGPELNEPGNYVIAGHNYNNGLFFGKNKNLQIGDKIYITDMNGTKVEYTIYNKYYTPETDYTYITRNTNGKAELTLYTCDATGKNRLIICARAD